MEPQSDRDTPPRKPHARMEAWRLEDMQMDAVVHQTGLSDGEVLRRVRQEVRSASALGRSLSQLEEEVSPQQAQRSQATENAWRSMEREFGFFDSAQVADRVGSQAKARSSWATDAHQHGRLMGVRRMNKVLYPAFQFGPGGPLDLIRQLRRAADELEVKEESVLLWLTAPTTWWEDDSRPVDHLDEPDEVLGAFRSHYGVAW